MDQGYGGPITWIPFYFQMDLSQICTLFPKGWTIRATEVSSWKWIPSGFSLLQEIWSMLAFRSQMWGLKMTPNVLFFKKNQLGMRWKRFKYGKGLKWVNGLSQDPEPLETLKDSISCLINKTDKVLECNLRDFFNTNKDT